MGLQYDVSLNGPANAHRHPGNANIRFNGFNAHDVLNSLQPRLAASTGSACTSGIPELSHVLKAIGLSDDEAASSIRFSLGQDTTDRCIDEAVTLIHEGLTGLVDSNLISSHQRINSVWQKTPDFQSVAGIARVFVRFGMLAFG